MTNKVYTPQDITVYFFAHDRGDFLRQALDCYLNQTVQGAKLVLLANAPSPDVLQVAKDYAPRGVQLHLEEKPMRVFECTRWCQQIAKSPITVMAHDDDLIHPAYLENVLHAYNTIADLAVCCSSMGEFEETPEYTGLSKAYVLTQPQFSAYIYQGSSFCFTSCSYKTELLKQAPAPDYDTYGKIFDAPFMLQATGSHLAAVFDFHFIRYRTHNQQDSQTFSTGPTAREWLNLEKLHRRLIFSAGSLRLRVLYAAANWFRLRMGWKDWCLCEHRKMNFSDYLLQAKEAGVYSRLGRFLGIFLHGKTRRKVTYKLLGITPRKI